MPTIAIGRLYILALIMFCGSVCREDLAVILFSVLPDVPMLDETIAAMAHVKDLNIDPVGIDRIIHALAPDAKPPFAIPHERDQILEVQEYLLTSDEKLSSDDREALAGLPVFLDDTQTPRPLSDLVQTDDDRLR